MARRITVIASMRNEGPFIVEWVAWYRALGFTDVLVVTNNCTDRSPELLDALGQAKRVHHMRLDPPPNSSITLRKLAAAQKHRSVRWSEWVFVCDVDEFLVIHKGTGQIEELIGPEGTPPPFVAMSINWKVFGTSGIEAFQDVPVHQQFFLSNKTGAGAKKTSPDISDSVKTIFARPGVFQRFSDHAPSGWDAATGGDWGKDANKWVNAAGKEIAGFTPFDGPLRQTPRSGTDHKVAQINHYMLRSAETFSLKAGTLSPVGRRDRYTPKYFTSADKGEEVDQSALIMAEAFAAEHARLMALPGVARLHALCCADHLRLIAQKQGRDPSADPRIAGFLAKAQELENGAPG